MDGGDGLQGRIEGVFVEGEDGDVQGTRADAHAHQLGMNEEVKQLAKQREIAVTLKGMPDWVYKNAEAAADRTLAAVRAAANMPEAWELASIVRGGRADACIGVVSLLINDPPDEDEEAALRGFYQFAIGINRERAAQFVAVNATAAPVQVLHELCTIDPEMNIGIEIGVARWGEKFEADVGVGWATPPDALLDKYKALKATEEGKALKFARVTFTQVAAGCLFNHRVDVRAMLETCLTRGWPLRVGLSEGGGWCRQHWHALVPTDRQGRVLARALPERVRGAFSE